MITRRTAIAASLAAPFAVRAGGAQAQAPSRAETLLLVQEYGPNSLDMQGIGSSQPVNGVALNCYDRLLRFKPVPIPGGGGNTIAMGELEGERAESWQIAPDGMSVTFKLRDPPGLDSRRTRPARCRPRPVIAKWPGSPASTNDYIPSTVPVAVR